MPPNSVTRSRVKSRPGLPLAQLLHLKWHVDPPFPALQKPDGLMRERNAPELKIGWGHFLRMGGPHHGGAL